MWNIWLVFRFYERLQPHIQLTSQPKPANSVRKLVNEVKHNRQAEQGTGDTYDIAIGRERWFWNQLTTQGNELEQQGRCTGLYEIPCPDVCGEHKLRLFKPMILRYFSKAFNRIGDTCILWLSQFCTPMMTTLLSSLWPMWYSIWWLNIWNGCRIIICLFGIVLNGEKDNGANPFRVRLISKAQELGPTQQ